MNGGGGAAEVSLPTRGTRLSGARLRRETPDEWPGWPRWPLLFVFRVPHGPRARKYSFKPVDFLPGRPAPSEC